MARRIAIGLLAAYALAGVAVAVAFLRAPPDGLANLGVALHAAPATALCLLAGRPLGLEFPCMPHALGYRLGHLALLVVNLAGVLAVAALIARRRRRLSRGAS
jgi:hypothetical protein